MKSIHTKIILVIFIGIIVSATVIGGIGLLSFKKVIDDDSVNIMNLTCAAKSRELNSVLGRIEQSVEILSVFSVDNLESTDKLLNDQEYLDEYTKSLSDLGTTIANETNGAVAVYVRFSPEVTSSTAGFFKVKNTRTGIFENSELTDLSKYSTDDIEHVGWYYLPVNEGAPIWLEPYYNKNINIYMISYVIPIYKDNVLIGVVGMDIDFNYLTEITDGIKIYETGEAFLMDGDLKIVHSKNYESGTLVKDLSESLSTAEHNDVDALYSYVLDGVKMKVAFRTLENGMCLAVTAPTSEIDSNKNRLVEKIIFVVFFIILIFLFIALTLSKSIVKPLKELNIAAKEIAGGNLEVLLDCKSKDEVGTLAESLKETANQLKIRIEYINNLAFMDKLTDTKNNTAYLQEVLNIKKSIKKGEFDFSVFIVDINGLKAINDTYGHDYGNKLIIAASKALTNVFGYENVYRIGGDEFAVIMKNITGDRCNVLKLEYLKEIKKNNGEIRLSAAIGSAVYDKNMDDSYESVFRRADDEMYKTKMKMKQNGEISSIETQSL